MSPLSPKSAELVPDAVRPPLTSLFAALTQTTNRERAAVGAIAATFLALLAGGLSYRSTHSRSVPPDGPANIVLRSASDADLPEATGGDADGSVEIEARGDSDDAAETTVMPSSADAGTPSATVAENGAGAAKSAESGASSALVVYVTGAVKRPGVYTFRSGDRLYHAVRAAGGFKASARQDALNLADRLEDGDQLYIPPRKAGAVAEAVALPTRRTAGAAGSRSAAPPFTPSYGAQTMARSLGAPSSLGGASRARGRVLGEVPPVAVVRVPVSAAPPSGGGGSAAGDGERSASAAPAKFKNPGDGMVNLNTATAADLEKISGIGPAMSARILAYRAQIGRFNDPQQLMDVKGIGEKKFAKMQPFVVVQ